MNTITGIQYGALAPRLYEQFKDQCDKHGRSITRRRLRYPQDAADAIVCLAVGRLISEGEKRRALGRLTRRIEGMFWK